MSIRLEMKQAEDVVDIDVKVKYKQRTEELNRLEKAIQSVSFTLIAEAEEQKIKLLLADIYYFESVDKKTFAYTNEGVYRIRQSLNDIYEEISSKGFARISKSVIVNIEVLINIRNISNSRLEATLQNEEKLLISRKYLKEIKAMMLHGGGQ